MLAIVGADEWLRIARRVGEKMRATEQLVDESEECIRLTEQTLVEVAAIDTSVLRFVSYTG